MAKNIFGGGSATNKNGLKFEQETQLKDALINNDFTIKNDIYVYNKKNECIGLLLQKGNLYSKFLSPKGVEWEKIISKKLLPDDSFFLYSNSTLYIIEKKFQNTSGSVDEKLQTCDFKKKQYNKLIKSLNSEYNVEYIYVLSDWFKKDSYRDVLDYITSVGCHYYFNEIPLNKLNLL